MALTRGPPIKGRARTAETEAGRAPNHDRYVNGHVPHSKATAIALDCCRRGETHLLRPPGNDPLGADDSVRVQDSIDHPPLHDVRPDDALADGVRVLAPRRLRDRLPRVAGRGRALARGSMHWDKQGDPIPGNVGKLRNEGR